jgi:hypothetical protein
MKVALQHFPVASVHGMVHSPILDTAVYGGIQWTHIGTLISITLKSTIGATSGTMVILFAA